MEELLVQLDAANADRPEQASGAADRVMDQLGADARAAALHLARTPPAVKTAALHAMAAAIRASSAEILAANAADMADADARGVSAALRDRLRLDPARVEAMAAGIIVVAAEPDPIGAVVEETVRPNGLVISRVRVPLGVVGVIYESRPNVTADAGALCIKAGNAVILRGGSESLRSSTAIALALRQGLREAGLPENAIQLVATTDRAVVGAMLRASRWIDVLIPRGGKSLVARVQTEARVPVLAHLDGNCHTYLHRDSDPAMAVAVTVNAKLRRTGVCGATETLLVDAAVAERLLPPVLDALIAGGCVVRGDAMVCRLEPRAVAADPADWDTEFLDAIIAVKVVEGIGAAIDHINRHGSHHTDSIVTEDAAAAARFLAEVDSAIVIHNASTQFADGAEFGMGAEIGIATGRLHARGPVGVRELTTYKHVVRGRGQVRP